MKRHRLIVFAFFLLFTRAHAQYLLPDSINVCQGDTAVLRINTHSIAANSTFQWTTPYAVIYNVKELVAKHSGKYYIKVYSGNAVIYDSTVVTIRPRPVLQLRDTAVCLGTPIVLNNNGNPSYRYLWNTDESTPSVLASGPGTYWVQVSNNGCIGYDTLVVSMLPSPIPSFGKEIIFCSSDELKTLSIKAFPGTKILWSNGSNQTSINASHEGLHWVRTSTKVCGTHIDSVIVKYKDCECEIFIPSSFTPNDDAKNDYFFPVLQCDYQYFNMSVFDRWGNIVYSSSNINGRWDGKFKGNMCPDDIYVYRMEAVLKNSEKKTVRTGHISLFR